MSLPFGTVKLVLDRTLKAAQRERSPAEFEHAWAWGGTAGEDEVIGWPRDVRGGVRRTGVVA